MEPFVTIADLDATPPDCAGDARRIARTRPRLALGDAVARLELVDLRFAPVSP